jgi:hypothetical protein
MSKNEKNLMLNLQVAKITGDIISKRKMGLDARIEGLQAYIGHKDIELTPEIIGYIITEMSDIMAKGHAILAEYKEFSAWTKENLPEKFHFDIDNLIN